MNENEIREKVEMYVKSSGVKYVFIATKIGVHRSTLCHFMKNDRRTADKVKNGLVDFLKELGVL
ncbi:hypothetical protein [Clostridium scatologenes]|uniref:HTH cro/C1-type domain-containing protein n=1 Tax=Clostridium scatologenes TaxID=1548 RepID=A0A0E3M874_CLOSL|nr:hypothetical protein [Clostridium scatologenes]AKA71228.1 hypothetical protein CSCA_4103 [Clostridium scatologenes]